MSKILERIGNVGLVPVVVIDDAKDAVPTAKALLAGGVDIMEITMRTDAALDAMRAVCEEVPEMLVGAGTVLSPDMVQQAVDAGCQFIVAPGLNPEVVRYCQKIDVPVTPGCVTPTEIEQAMSLGLRTLKFFPAGMYGGVNGCKNLYGPYRMIKFIPTGGVSISNLEEYVDKPYIHAIGGSWLCPTKMIAEGAFDAITKACRNSVEILIGFEVFNPAEEESTPNRARAEYHLLLSGYIRQPDGSFYHAEWNKAVRLK